MATTETMAGQTTEWPLVFPTEAELAQYWGREVLCKRKHAVDAPRVLTMNDVHQLLCDDRTRSPHIALYTDGRPVDPRRYSLTRNVGGSLGAGFLNQAKVREFLAAGASLKFSGLHEYWPPAARLRAAVQERTGLSAAAAAIISPPGHGAFVLHQDVEHVLVLQTGGSKQWQIYDRFPGQSSVGSVSLPEGVEAAHRITLTEGDVLYVPTGRPHVAQSTEEWSLHVTISVRPVTAVDVLRPRIEELLAGLGMTEVSESPFIPPNGDGEEAIAEVAAHIAEQLTKTPWQVPRARPVDLVSDRGAMAEVLGLV